MGYGGWKPYVSVAERRKKAELAAAKAKKAGAVLSPIASYRGAIAKTFWGNAWCDNLERYSDYANRLPRGRTYVRNGSVIDLQITAGEVRAQVMGSNLYTVAVNVTACPEKQWQAIGADCAGSIDSIVELLQGKLSTAAMERICKAGTGLFPAPKEITFKCSCPDWASMCKHVAAVLYCVGARLDQQPEFLFALRRVDPNDLVSQVGAGLPKSRKRPATGKVLDDALVADVFGLEMAEASPTTKPAAGRKEPSAVMVLAKKTAKPTVSTTRKPPATAKTASDDKAVTKKLPVKPSTGPRKSTSGNVIAAKAKVANSPATPKEVATRQRASARPAKGKSR